MFLGVAGFAVFFVALAKAGFGGMIASLAMPLVAAFSDITTAISVLLPTYIVMDIILAWVYRKTVPYAMLWPMAAAGIVGVFIAAVVFRYIDTNYLAIFLGAMSFVIGVKFYIVRARQKSEAEATLDPSVRNWPRLIGLNGATGFTSFFLMGEAPIQMFLLPFRLAPQVYVSLLIWYFFLINIVKVPIAFGIGLVTIDSLWVSACLLPIMPLGMFIGKRINQRISKDPFYMVIHVLLVILGVYLVVNAFAQMGAA